MWDTEAQVSFDEWYDNVEPEVDEMTNQDCGKSCDGDHTVCDICDGIEHNADLTPDWNGETGCHESCEADEGLTE